MKIYKKDKVLDVNGRSNYITNIKALLITLVVVGHMLTSVRTGDTVARVIYNSIYIFHMPAFIFITGYLSKGAARTWCKAKKATITYILLYLVAQVIYDVIQRWALPTGKTFEFTIFTPRYALWYMLLLTVWTPLLYIIVKCNEKIVGYIMKNISNSFTMNINESNKYKDFKVDKEITRFTKETARLTKGTMESIKETGRLTKERNELTKERIILLLNTVTITISIILALIVGLDPEIGTEYSLSRGIVFFPFYLVGYYFDMSVMERFKGDRSKAVAIMLMVTNVWVQYTYLTKIYASYYTGSVSYSGMNLTNNEGILNRSKWMLAAFLLIWALLVLVPKGEFVFTYIGNRTLQIYLIHAITCRIFYIRNTLVPIKEVISVWGIIVLGLIFTVVLSYEKLGVLVDWPGKLLYNKNKK